MSGLEVIGGISAVIAILDASIKVWNNARKDVKFSTTFETVANRLPVIRDTLDTCQRHFDDSQASLAAETEQSFKNIIQNCTTKAEQVEIIFRETLCGPDERRRERYLKAFRRLGKGSKVEDLLEAIAGDVQCVVDLHVVKSVSPEAHAQLEDIIEEMKNIEPSISSVESNTQAFNANNGPQNIFYGNSTHYSSSNTGSGTTHNYGGITGDLVFNFAHQAPFVGEYSYSSTEPSSNYVPRSDLEQQLLLNFPDTADEFPGMRTAVVWGLGGAGKSQIARCYVKKQRKRYQAVFWVAAGQRETIERDFIQIYKQIYRDTVIPTSTVSIDDAVAGVKSWLHGRKKRCLWVMDSADDVHDDQSDLFIDLARMLPESPYLDRIVTSRSSDLQSLSTLAAVKVEQLSTEQAIQLLQGCAGIAEPCEDDRREMQLIVDTLGCLALAVTLAGSYIRAMGLSSHLNQYLVEYQQDRTRLLDYKASVALNTYRSSVLTTWETSMRAVRLRSPLAYNLMSLVAFLHHDDIFMLIFQDHDAHDRDSQLKEGRPDGSTLQRKKLKDKVSRWFGRTQPSSSMDKGKAETSNQLCWCELLSPDSTTIKQLDIKEALHLLEMFSLISWNAKTKSFFMHKLVHAWAHDRLIPTDQRLWCLAGSELLGAVNREKVREMETDNRLVPHIMANFAAISSKESNLLPSIDIRAQENIAKSADLLYRVSRFREVCQVRAKLAEIMEETYGQSHIRTLDFQGRLSIALRLHGQYAESEQLARRVYQVSTRQLGLDHPMTLSAGHYLAESLRCSGKLHEAKSLAMRILALREAVLGPDHHSTLGSTASVASLCYYVGDYEVAERMYKQLISLQEQRYSATHDIVLGDKYNFALCVGQLGRFEEEEALLREILPLREQAFGKNHYASLLVKGSLATSILNRNNRERFQEAEILCLETSDAMSQLLGPKHPVVLECMSRLGAIYRQSGKYKEAEAVLMETFLLTQEVLGGAHPMMLYHLDSIAMCYQMQGQYERAETLLTLTSSHREQSLGLEHPLTVTSEARLRQVQRQRQRAQHPEAGMDLQSIDDMIKLLSE